MSDGNAICFILGLMFGEVINAICSRYEYKQRNTNDEEQP